MAGNTAGRRRLTVASLLAEIPALLFVCAICVSYAAAPEDFFGVKKPFVGGGAFDAPK